MPPSPALKDFLDQKVAQYNQAAFVQEDPIQIPHSYQKLQDIEIAGFLAATLAWGRRQVTIQKCQALLGLMDHAPHDFVRNHQPQDLQPLLQFKHRTFNATDLCYFMYFLQHYYQQHDSLEEAFWAGMTPQDTSVAPGLRHFHQLFFSLPEAPARTRKHVATPARQSACKRLNMFLRWMVRQDDRGVDLGLWQQIRPHQLVCPCDVHVGRTARKLGLLQRAPTDWAAALELTHHLRALAPHDPVQYDFALFGLGVEGAF